MAISLYKKSLKILIANRGEIAVRVIRACKEMGIPCVAIYSEVDRGSAHVALADEVCSLGDGSVGETYLHQEKILSIAKSMGANALHPGFGFFSENGKFARECEKRKITFIGPSPEAIEMMGDKLRARKAMEDAGVPVVPGSPGPVASLKEAHHWAEKIGYPLLLKASAGGGGKGIRMVSVAKELDDAFENTSHEAEVFFGDGTLFMERFIPNSHHIEVQVLGDKHGNSVHLFERECSIQRRHQKVIEEAPSPFLLGHDSVRNLLFEAALLGAKNIHYDSVGTMEFIVDDSHNFYFLEMNTRIQVEHPVTEWITGLDLVKEQIRIALGEELSFTQENIQQRGHSIEVRLYAEDPNTFLPAPGTVQDTWYPGGPFVRIDTSILNGQTIPMEYDPMITKISTWGGDRTEALQRMDRCLGETLVAGTVTNLPFLRKTIQHGEFQSGNYTTNFIASNKASLQSYPTKEEMETALAYILPQEKSYLEMETGVPASWTQENHD